MPLYHHMNSVASPSVRTAGDYDVRSMLCRLYFASETADSPLKFARIVETGFVDRIEVEPRFVRRRQPSLEALLPPHLERELEIFVNVLDAYKECRVASPAVHFRVGTIGTILEQSPKMCYRAMN